MAALELASRQAKRSTFQGLHVTADAGNVALHLESWSAIYGSLVGALFASLQLIEPLGRAGNTATGWKHHLVATGWFMFCATLLGVVIGAGWAIRGKLVLVQSEVAGAPKANGHLITSTFRWGGIVAVLLVAIYLAFLSTYSLA
jgi:hypothetical protein